MTTIESVKGLSVVLTQGSTILRRLRQSNLSDQHQGLVTEALDVVSDAAHRLLTLQTALIELQDDNAALKAKLALIENWEARRSQYKLVKTSEGGIVLESNEPFHHYACVRCAETNRQIHPLQYNGEYSGSYGCQECGKNYDVHKARPVRFPG